MKIPDLPVLLTSRQWTDRMHAKMREDWDVVFYEDIDLDAFIAERGDAVKGMTPGFHGRVDGPLMDRLPNLGVISNFGVGYDNIDAKAAADRGIIATHTPGVLNDETANTAIMLFLATHRQLVAHDAYLRAGRWPVEGNAPLTRGIAGQKVGVLGMGRIGQSIAKKLEAFGVDILYHTRTPKDAPYLHVSNLIDMAQTVDSLIVITPGGAATEKLVNAEVMNALGPRGTLINIARGSVVDEAALISALQDGRLGFAGLDVFEDEPNVPQALIDMDHITLLPHVGSATIETRQAMGDLVCDNLSAWLKTGKAIRPVPECQDL